MTTNDISNTVTKMNKQANLYKCAFWISLIVMILCVLSMFVLPVTGAGIIIGIIGLAIFYTASLYFMGKAHKIERDLKVLILCHIKQ